MPDKAHCERFNELPEHTKLFLETLTPEKIKAIDKGVKATETIETLGWFWKWTILLMLGAFTSVAAAVQAFDWLANRFK